MGVSVGDEWSPEQPFRDELWQDETLLWTGRPNPNVLWEPADACLVPFFTLWGGFAIVWEAIAIYIAFAAQGRGSGVWAMPLFGIPFVLIGLYLMVGRFIYKRWRRQRTYYGLTSKRVLTMTRAFRPRLTALLLKDLDPGQVTCKAKSDGSGTILFVQGSRMPRGSWQAGGDPGTGPLGGRSLGLSSFDSIPNVQEVHGLLTRQMSSKEGGW